MLRRPGVASKHEDAARDCLALRDAACAAPQDEEIKPASRMREAGKRKR
jgi:hypothetical protein